MICGLKRKGQDLVARVSWVRPPVLAAEGRSKPSQFQGIGCIMRVDGLSSGVPRRGSGRVVVLLFVRTLALERLKECRGLDPIELSA